MTHELLSPEEQLTIATYNQNAAHWAEENYHGMLWAEDLKELKNHLPAGRILDIGAGSGTDVEKLISAGYQYLGTDVSAAQVAEARRLHPQVEFMQRSVYDLDFPAGSFDGFWAAAILIHLPRAKVGLALDQIRQVIKPGGVGFISLKKGKGEAVTNEPATGSTTYHRLFTYYTKDEFTKILAKHHFDVLSVKSRKLRPNLTWLKFIVQSKQT